jgi:hypothetical protein
LYEILKILKEFEITIYLCRIFFWKRITKSHKIKSNSNNQLILKKINMRKNFGIALISGSLLVWILVLILLFSEISVNNKPLAISILLILNKIIFSLGLYLVGKSVWEKYKEQLKKKFLVMKIFKTPSKK